MGKMYKFVKKEGKAAKALRKVNKLNRMLKPEIKYGTIPHNSQTVSSTGTTEGHLTGIAQGDTAQTRDGNQIHVISAEVRGHVYADAASSGVSVIRLILVRDKQQVADTNASFTNVFGTSNVDVLPYHARIERFQILRDQTFTLPVTGERVKSFHWKVKLNLPVHYNDIANTDIQKNGVYLMAVSNEPTNMPVLYYTSRIKFYDN